ncbi:MAG: beta-lactamase family protein [Cyclobacteriaceae bacterium]|nr:beta-lactamase family protein [Cyclobacteriaceae bacterium]
MKKIPSLAIVIFIIVSSCKPKEEESSLSKNLDSFFSSQYSSDQPGGAVLILKDTSILFSKGYGLADLKTKEAITTKTLFNLGSISKTIVANGILILQEQGKLSVEDSLLKYFPDFKNKEIAKKVRIKHLLTHTSGLPDNRQVVKDSVFFLTANDEQNWYPITQTDTLEFEPGSKYNYSNPSYNALALIIQKVSGQKWQDFIKEKIFIPGNMPTSTITDGAHPHEGVSHGYTMIAHQWTEDDYGEEPTFCASGNGGVWSSVEELANYEIALRKAAFLSKTSIDDSRTIKTFSNWRSSHPADRGWSWQILKVGNYNTAEHTGSQGGFMANYVAIPEKGILLVVLNNAPYDVNLQRDKIISLLEEEKWLE